MTKSEINAYANRVTTANKTELIVIMFEVAQSYIKSALEEFSAGNVESYKYNLKKAKQFVTELNGSLNFNYKISYELMSIYSFVNRTLLNAILTQDTSNLQAVIDILAKLCSAFEEISKQDNSGPVMKNVQSVYAGLTYSKSNLNETCDTQANRGYLV